MSKPSGFQLGPWLLTSKIASGGMGEVFVGLRAGADAAQKPVAVKALLPRLSDDDKAVGRFLAEAQFASRLDHPRLVRVLEVGAHGGRHWMAMELVRGPSLQTLLDAARQAGGSLPPEVLTFIGRALADGLDHAHAARGDDGAPLELVHRDVTPHNLLVSVDGEVKLTDFGVAQVAGGREFSKAGQVHGKLEYVSPEQLDHQHADRRTDVYAAGVTLFTLATGKGPFARSTPQDTTRAIRNEAPEDLAALRPDLPPAFVAAVKRAMARKPADRFATAGELRDALGPAAEGAQQALAQLVRALCPLDVGAITEAVQLAEALAPEAANLRPPPASAAPIPRPRGTLEVVPIRLERNLPWKWLLLAGVGALAAAAAFVFWY